MFHYPRSNTTPYNEKDNLTNKLTVYTIGVPHLTSLEIILPSPRWIMAQRII